MLYGITVHSFTVYGMAHDFTVVQYGRFRFGFWLLCERLSGMKLEAFKAWAVAGPLRVRPQKHAPKCVSLAVSVVSALPPVVKQSTIFKHVVTIVANIQTKEICVKTLVHASAFLSSSLLPSLLVRR